MRTNPASIVVLSGAIITSAWLAFYGNGHWMLVGLSKMTLGAIFLVCSWFGNCPRYIAV